MNDVKNDRLYLAIYGAAVGVGKGARQKWWWNFAAFKDTETGRSNWINNMTSAVIFAKKSPVWAHWIQSLSEGEKAKIATALSDAAGTGTEDFLRYISFSSIGKRQHAVFDIIFESIVDNVRGCLTIEAENIIKEVENDDSAAA